MLRKLKSFFTKNKVISKAVDEVFEANKRVRTPVQNLSLGMYVADLDISWLESPFLFQGFMIETEAELEQLRDVCEYVYIDVSRQTKRKATRPDSSRLTDNEPLMIAKPPQRLSCFEQEIARAQSVYKETGKTVSYFMNKIALGDGVDGKLARESVSACVNSVLHSPDAMLWLMQLKNKDEYTAQHSLNICVLSIVLGRYLGFSEQKLNYVGLCGMMHDMGKILVPAEILNKPGKLDAEELEVMKSHTTLGYELLKSSEHMYYGAVETALMHHERVDGQGYPRRVMANGLSIYTRIVAVADVYDAITSDRVYQQGLTHHQATKIMLDESGGHLDPDLVIKFIESIGVYPPGCYVELSDGSIALVVEESARYKLRPKVLIILDQDKNFIDASIIDLSKMISDRQGYILSIKAIINPADYQINREKYYRQGVIQRGFTKRGWV